MRNLQLLACLGLYGLSGALAASQPIPIEAFAKPHAIMAPRLSPDGKHLAFRVPGKDQREGVAVLDLATGKTKVLNAGNGIDVSSARWLNDDRLIFMTTKLKRYAYGVFTADRTTFTMTSLSRYDASSIISFPQKRPHNLFLWIRQSSGGDGQDYVAEIDARRGVSASEDSGAKEATPLRIIEKPPGRTSAWLTDPDGEIRGCVIADKAVRKLYWRTRDDEPWRESTLDLDDVHPLDFDLDPRFLFATAYSDSETRGLYRINLETGEFGECLLRDELYDLTPGYLRFSPKTGRAIGYSYVRESSVVKWFDEERQKIQAQIDQALPGRVNRIVDSDNSEKKFLIHSRKSTHPGLYYLYDTETNEQFRLPDPAPWIDENTMAPMQLVTFKARDGLKLQGFLTLPRGASKTSPVPLVALVHGGPWVRDQWGFHPDVQFLASRGYAVFQPNYRGSDGYGFEVSYAPRYEFKKMHEDVTDGVRAVLKLGLVDPERVAIMGASFGGYLTGCGLAFEPDLYRCGVSVCGVFDWTEMMKTDRFANRYRYARMKKFMGDPDKSREVFDAISPLTAVAQIRSPILIAHGKADGNVSIAQSRLLVRALKQQGTPHETFYRDWEGHGFFNYENKVALYKAIEAFLVKNL